VTHIPNKDEQMVRSYGFYSNKSRGLRKKAGIDDSEIIKKVLKHLDLWDVKRYPAPRANGLPTETFIIYDESSSLSADDYLIDADYPIEIYL
jgi:hypothetical protein